MKRWRKPKPWARIAGMAASVLVTLICVALQLDPMEILRRAVLAFLLIAAVTAALSYVLQMFAERPIRRVR